MESESIELKLTASCLILGDYDKYLFCNFFLLYIRHLRQVQFIEEINKISILLSIIVCDFGCGLSKNSASYNENFRWNIFLVPSSGLNLPICDLHHCSLI